MFTLIRATATIAVALAVIAGLAACTVAGPVADQPPSPSTISTIPKASPEVPAPSESPVADPSPCGAGGVHADEKISGYVTDVLGVPVIDTWAGIDRKTAIICIAVAHDDGSVQRAIDVEFGEGQAHVVSRYASNKYEVTTRARMTVVDDGERSPQLCWLMYQSLPPECEGVDLVGWDWGSADRPFEEQSGVRWGEYFVTGTYSFESDALTVETATVDGPDIGFAWDGATGAICEDGSERIPEEFRPVYDQGATQIVSETYGVQSQWVASDGCDALAIGVAFDDGRLQQLFEQDSVEARVVIVPLLRELE